MRTISMLKQRIIY